MGGVSTSYSHDPTGRFTGLSTDGRSVQYGYDALGRNTSVADTTRLGTQTTTRTWSGGAAVQQSTTGQGSTTLLYDAVGQLSAQGNSDETRWDLLDRLGSAVAQTDAGGLIDQLVDYSDFGVQFNESTGWDALAGYTGEADDPTSGLNVYAARAYQPSVGTWTSADPWRGDTASPQTLNRYAYTVGNPTTLIDVGGNKPWDPAFKVVGKKNGEWVLEKATPPKTGTVTTLGKGKPKGKPGPKTPSNKNKTTASHEEWWNPFTWSSVSTSWAALAACRDLACPGKWGLKNAAQMLGGFADTISSAVTCYICIAGQQVADMLTDWDAYNARREAQLRAAQQWWSNPWNNFWTPIANDWANNPGHALGGALGAAATVAVPGGAGVRGTTPASKVTQGSTAIRSGSGPVAGVLEASATSRSLAALRNYVPKGGVEYVFDPATGVFATGRPSSLAGLSGSPHQQLAASIGAEPSSVVGGTLTRNAQGVFVTTENSGHYWQNWTPAIRKQFVETMNGYGFDVSH